MLRPTLCLVCLLVLAPVAARADDAGATAAVASEAQPVDGSGGSGGGPGKLGGLVVFLDAGHGGKQDGAVGARGQKEKDVALQVVQRLKGELEKSGAKVLLTREADVDVDLWHRMTRANEAKADLFVSVHCNAMPYGRARAVTRGIETYFLSADATDEQAQRVVARENGEAKRLKRSVDPLASILDDLAQTEAHHDASAFAYAVHQQIVEDLGAADRGVQQAPFIVLMGAQMPAILVEVGFLSHPEESKLLSDKDYQARIAASLVRAIVSFGESGKRHKALAPVARPAGPKAAAEAKHAR